MFDRGFEIALVIAVIVVLGMIFAMLWQHRRSAQSSSLVTSQGEATDFTGDVGAQTSAPLAGVHTDAMVVSSAQSNNDEVELAWRNLKELLGEKPTGGRSPHPLSRGGRFNHRSGVQFTVVHIATTCVIVRWNKGSRKVERVLVDKKVPRVLYGTEQLEREEFDPKSGPWPVAGILPEQARVTKATEFTLMEPMKITDLLVQLQESYYKGPI